VSVLSGAPLYTIWQAVEWASPAFLRYLDLHSLDRSYGADALRGLADTLSCFRVSCISISGLGMHWVCSLTGRCTRAGGIEPAPVQSQFGLLVGVCVITG
jgi:hypothetical protein